MYFSDKNVDVVIRPEDWDIVPRDSAKVIAKVTSSIFKGVHYEIQIESAIGICFMAQTTQHFPVGSFVGISVVPDNFQIMHKPQSEDEEILKNDGE